MLGRHSALSMTPETFFMRMVDTKRPPQQFTHEKLLDQLFDFSLTADLHLDRERMMQRFRQFSASYSALFRCVLEEYLAEHGAGKSRIGEKTPRHLENVQTLLEWFPEARIVCIVRDGRDVALSLLNMPWNNEPRLRGVCLEWMRMLKLAEKWRGRYPQQFMMMRYEDLLDRPRDMLEQVDQFLGLAFEEQQLDPHFRPPNVVPASELGWKGQALEIVDPSRKATWKKKATAEQLVIMNTLMGDSLQRMGYGETEPQCGTIARVRVGFGNALFRTGAVSLWHKLVERNLPKARAERRRRRKEQLSALETAKAGFSPPPPPCQKSPHPVKPNPA
jgi:hypothetical protein